ncbi:MAG: CPBP family intramembrane metalloprotease [Candidatus Omnitrophica bacterium]|nr:CPBP family intramembrane metalloprotease [Candidatus Omnitrophota bacterium]
MSQITMIIFFVLLFLDVQFLKRYNRDHFKDIFRLSLIITASFTIASVLLAVFSPEPKTILNYFFLVSIVPAYLLNRNRFLHTDKEKPLDYLNTDDRKTKFYLIFEWFHVLILSFYVSILFEILTERFLVHLSEISRLMLSTIFLTFVSTILIYKSSIRFSAEGFWVNVGFKKNISKMKSIFVPALVGLVFAGLSSAVIIQRGEYNPSTPMTEALATADSPVIIFIFIVWAWLVAPLFEEILFRGYSFQIFEKVKGQRFAIYTIALSFAVLHVGQYWGDWLAISIIALLAFAITLLRAWSGTTQAGLITHYIYNIGVVIVPVFVLVITHPYYFEYQAKYSSLTPSGKEELLLNSIQQQPEWSLAYNDLAWLYSEENIKLDEALRLVEQALKISPDNDIYLDTKAEILERLGNYSEALEIRKKICEISADGSLQKTQKERMEQLKKLISAN